MKTRTSLEYFIEESNFTHLDSSEEIKIFGDTKIEARQWIVLKYIKGIYIVEFNSGISYREENTVEYKYENQEKMKNDIIKHLMKCNKTGFFSLLT